MYPEALGNFDYLVRFSTDNGATWVYGDVDGWFPIRANPRRITTVT